MTRTPEQVAEGNRRYDAQMAKSNIEDADPHTMEYECRAAARWLERDENNWEDLIPMFEAIEFARLQSIRYRVKTPEDIESWRNYMMNR